MHNRKRDNETQISHGEGMIHIVMGVLLFAIVAGCIIVMIYLNSAKERKNPTSNNTIEYSPTETTSVKKETSQQSEYVPEVTQTPAVMTEQPETMPETEAVVETVVVEQVREDVPVASDTVENEIPEIVQEDEVIIIPDYTNQDSSRTEIKLQSAGLRVDRKYEYSNVIPTDAVIRTEPAAGEKTEQGSKICVVVSQGSEMISAEMPELIGQEIDYGKEIMQPYGVDIEIEEIASSESAGTILSQSIQAGEIVEQGESLSLTVSSGEEKMGMITYSLEIPAEETSHFVLDFFDEESNHIASSGSLNSAYVDHEIIVTLEGTGTQKVYVILQNMNTGLSAEVGSYNFYYTDGCYAAINEDVQLAFQEVSATEEPTTEPTEELTETTETTETTVETEE